MCFVPLSERGQAVQQKAVSAALLTVTERIMLEELPGSSSPAFERFDTGHSHQQSCLHMALQRASKNSRASLRVWRELFFSCLCELAFEIQQMKRMTLALEEKNLVFNVWQYLLEPASGEDKQAQCWGVTGCQGCLPQQCVNTALVFVRQLQP